MFVASSVLRFQSSRNTRANAPTVVSVESINLHSSMFSHFFSANSLIFVNENENGEKRESNEFVNEN